MAYEAKVRLCSEALVRRLHNKSMENTEGIVESIKIPIQSHCHQGQRLKIMIALYLRNQANIINEFISMHYALCVTLFL